MTPIGHSQANIDQIMANSSTENDDNVLLTRRNPLTSENGGGNGLQTANLASTISNEFSDDQDRGLSSDDNEARPLLTSHFASYNDNYNDRETSAGGSGSDTASSMFRGDSFSTYTASISDKIVQFSRRRFWWFCGLGVVAVIILNLSFLPRTSLSRDYRRIHNLHLTKDDVKRNYLVYSGDKQLEQYTNTQEIDWLLRNFTELNSQHPVNLVAGDNEQLASFVIEKFRKSGVKTSVYNYNSNLSRPINSSVVLYKAGEPAYTFGLQDQGFSTPNYYGFGAAGSVKGGYIFANEGTDLNYQALRANGLDLHGKIAIIKSEDVDVPISDKVLAAEKYGIVGLIHYMEPVNGTGITQVKRSTVVQNAYGTGNFSTPLIPIIPVSYKELVPVLETLNAPLMQADFDFELAISCDFNNHQRTLTNVIGHIDGIIKDGEIIIGSSRDSFDSSNPLSNQVIMLEIMRHFHKLIKLGWKPLRNLKFISFDGGRNGQYGVQKFLEDDNIKKNVLAYINIDEDAVRGTQFDVEANPMLNHILTKVSKAIPIPEEYLTEEMEEGREWEVEENDETTRETDEEMEEVEEIEEIEDDEDDNDDDDDDDSSLYKYWKYQSNSTIINTGTRTGGFPFQYHFNTPTINIKFNNGNNNTRYIANSNDYSYKWVKKTDPDLVLHHLLIRYVGLLVITLSEHEVIDFKAHDYFTLIEQETSKYLRKNAKHFTKWNDIDITKYLDIPFFNFNGDEDDIVTFEDLKVKLHDVARSLRESSAIFDHYNVQVQRGLIQDYPWYQLYKKLRLWAQFKVSNYKLIHMDRDLSRKKGWFNHLVYNQPEVGSFIDSSTIFTDLQIAVDEGLKKTVELMFEMYEKLAAIDKKIG